MLLPTRTDPGGPREWVLDDDIIHLREWASERVYPLPSDGKGEWTIGASSTCPIRIVDTHRFVSRRHAQLTRDDRGWTLRDLASKNGLWADDARLAEFGLAPGIEIGIGSLRLIAESRRLVELRAHLARLLGWAYPRWHAIDEALRAIRITATLRAPLALSGDGDLVATMHEIHDRVFGRERPFIVCDPRRRHAQATSRSVTSRATGLDAIEAARGGTVCVWANRLPSDYLLMRARLAHNDLRVRLVVCHRDPSDAPDTAAAIRLPPLSDRAGEIERIIDEYAHDAIVMLNAKPSSFTDQERDWLRNRRPGSLSEIARATERLVAIREFGSIANGAARLGISRVALARWLNRRQ
ncbi:MAG TPA: FHA domain-containing protein [Kofleriaceae bacterium]|jgi:hypothetical protein|nr:FHA domain-containing protein [Kofleriaceae bacterium]